MKWWDRMPWSSFSTWWPLSQLFHSPLLLSSRGFLVLLHFPAIRVVSSAYLRLLIFLLAILIPACASSSPIFHMMYSAYRLNKQGDNIQPWHILFLIWNQSIVPCPVLTVASWPAYKFLRRQVRWSGIHICLRIFHSLLWSTLSKTSSIVSETEIAVFLKFPCFLCDPVDVGNLASGSSAFSKSSFYIQKFQFTYCWSLAWRILSITLLVCEIMYFMYK